MRPHKKKNKKLPAAEPPAVVKNKQTDSTYTGIGAGVTAGRDQDSSTHIKPGLNAHALRKMGDLELNQGQIEAAQGHYAEAELLYRQEQNVLGLVNVLQSMKEAKKLFWEELFAVSCVELSHTGTQVYNT